MSETLRHAIRDGRMISDAKKRARPFLRRAIEASKAEVRVVISREIADALLDPGPP